MAEQFTIVKNLYDFPEMINLNIEATPSAKILLIGYSDGQIFIDGTFRVVAGQTISGGETLIDFRLIPPSEVELQRLFDKTFHSTFVLLFSDSDLAPPDNYSLAGAKYSGGDISYETGDLNLNSLLSNSIWHFQLTLIPLEISPTGSLLWSK